MVDSEANVLESVKALPRPHGGRLVNRIVSAAKREKSMAEVAELPSIEILEEAARDVENIAMGLFSPIEGFLTREDLHSVVKEKRLTVGVAWTIPILLDVDKEILQAVKEGDEVVLSSRGGFKALLNIEEIYSYDKKELAQGIFGTLDGAHPGVARTYQMKDLFVGGKIQLIEGSQNPFGKYRLTPKEARALFMKNGWKTVAGFQTRNVPHLGHEYIQKTALTFVDGIFINPIIGRKKKGDFKDEVILATYEALIKNYFIEERTVLGILQTEMRYAGPKEAIFHAIIRKNFGCTHFIVGRDHAGVGDFYTPYAAHDIFKEFPDLEITPLFFPSVFLCDVCQSITNDKACPHSQKCHQEFSGTKMREALRNGETENLKIRPEVAKILTKWNGPIVEEEINSRG